MKKIVLAAVSALILGFTTVSAHAIVPPDMLTKQCKTFDKNQRRILGAAYALGEPNNLGWSLAAIAWQESSAGKHLVNWKDPSFGVFQILLKTAAAHEGFSYSKEPQRALHIANRLVYDMEYASEHAMQVLDFWLIHHKRDWRKAWASYNAGKNWHGKAGQKYANDIVNKIRYLKANPHCLEI